VYDPLVTVSPFVAELIVAVPPEVVMLRDPPLIDGAVIVLPLSTVPEK
jgi:hypothetical protein